MSHMIDYEDDKKLNKPLMTMKEFDKMRSRTMERGKVQKFANKK